MYDFDLGKDQLLGASAWMFRCSRGDDMSGRPLTPDDPRHGTDNGYTNFGCRCLACTDAWRIEHRAFMARHPEQRAKHRIRARIRNGHTLAEAAEMERTFQESYG